jgi:hypothetical protein
MHVVTPTRYWIGEVALTILAVRGTVELLAWLAGAR